MKIIFSAFILFIVSIMGCHDSSKKQNTFDIHDIIDIEKELEDSIVTVELKYVGWGCPCPQWITLENRMLYDKEKEINPSSEKYDSLFWHVIPANDTIPSPFDLTNDMSNLLFRFTGRFFKERKLMGVEGECYPAKTLLYYNVEWVNHNN